ncbi:MAG: helix-turn-helix domain-containing protein [Chitinispirillales bacterium]|nr:helix-turn-helix domain-containing protein [Chitinispirillales bacterium]
MDNRRSADSVVLTAKHEGRLEGRQKQQVENVKRMYRKGHSVAVIADALDLSESEVKKILEL